MTARDYRFPLDVSHTKGPAWGVGSMNEYGEPDGAMATIAARVDPKFTRVVGAGGEEHQSQIQVLTPSEVRVGDVLAVEGVDQTVLAAAPNRGLGDTNQFWTVIC